MQEILVPTMMIPMTQSTTLLLVRMRLSTPLVTFLRSAVIVLIAIVVPIYFVMVKPKSSSNNSSVSTSSPTTSSGQPSSTVVVTGGNGSTITMEDGTTFTYLNSFGGTWYWNPEDPFNNNAQAQSWSPPLNQSFRFGIDKIFGVNLGGWLTTEPVTRPLFIRNTLMLSMSGH
ncbi:hypothetical protein BDR04DRAFT_808591 [Suillus decipiens]|nr:hypothetical protein BDR04DRAFT_808591 [Suillus decipiens]